MKLPNPTTLSLESRLSQLIIASMPSCLAILIMIPPILPLKFLPLPFLETPNDISWLVVSHIVSYYIISVISYHIILYPHHISIFTPPLSKKSVIFFFTRPFCRSVLRHLKARLFIQANKDGLRLNQEFHGNYKQ